MTQEDTEPTIRKKAKFKKVYWILIGLAVAITVLVLSLLHRPDYFAPPEAIHSNEVSPYLTHKLSPAFYNGLQRQEPFELVVTQEGISDVIARSKWPKHVDDIKFLTPQVLFVPEHIVLMATAVVKNVEFVITVVVKPYLDAEALLNLQVVKVKIGAVNITPLAGVIAKELFQRQVSSVDARAEKPLVQIVASMLNNEAFEPVFRVGDNKVRVAKIAVVQEKLTVQLSPISD